MKRLSIWSLASVLVADGRAAGENLRVSTPPPGFLEHERCLGCDNPGRLVIEQLL